MSKKILASKIYEAAYITGEFLLRSGKISNEYFDKYQFEANPELLDSITDMMVEMLPPDTEVLGALEMGGIPIATLLSLKTKLPICFIRKQAKEYGTCRLAEGSQINGKIVTLIEDVVTSGGQIIISAKELREQGAIINNALCVIDREQGGTEALLENEIHLTQLFTMSELKESCK